MVNFEQTYKEVIDYLGPSQTVYEQTIYQLLFRMSHAEGRAEVRAGQRQLARIGPLPTKTGMTNRGGTITRSSQAQIRTTVESLQHKGHIQAADTTFQGTLFRVLLPREIPECMALITEAENLEDAKIAKNDFYKIQENRIKVFERDGFRCRYCDTKITPGNATLDHIKRVSDSGTHAFENLVTCCLKCNAIKGARKPDETLLDLLDRFKPAIKHPEEPALAGLGESNRDAVRERST